MAPSTRTKSASAVDDPPKPDDEPDPPKPDDPPAPSGTDEATVKGWIAEAIAEALKDRKPDDPEPIVDLSTDKKIEAFTEKLVKDVMEVLKKAEAERPPPPAPAPEVESVPVKSGAVDWIRSAIWGHGDD